MESFEAGLVLSPSHRVASGAKEENGRPRSHSHTDSQRQRPLGEPRRGHVYVRPSFEPAERNINLFERLSVNGALKLMPVTRCRVTGKALGAEVANRWPQVQSSLGGIFFGSIVFVERTQRLPWRGRHGGGSRQALRVLIWPWVSCTYVRGLPGL